jgi:hypothetical protein
MSREWFSSVVDNVIVGHIQCESESRKDDFLSRFPGDSSMFKDEKNPNWVKRDKGCLNMAFKVDREMTKSGSLQPEKFIRIVRHSNRRKYAINTEPMVERRDRDAIKNYNSMAFSLSHAPTCLTHMHRFVESCGVVMCSADSDMTWGNNDQGTKAILCNNANAAEVVTTSVIGNYPSDVSECRGEGQPYEDTVSLVIK